MLDENTIHDVMGRCTNLEPGDVDWLLEWHPEFFEGFGSPEDLAAHVDSGPAFGHRVRVVGERELEEMFGEYRDGDGDIDPPDATVVRDAGISTGIMVIGYC